MVYSFGLSVTVWGVEPVVTHHTSWLESTGVTHQSQHSALTALQV